MIASNARRGYTINELVIPTMAAMDAGYAVVLATPSGARPVPDEISRNASCFGGSELLLKAAIQFIEDTPAMQKPRALRAVIDAGLEDYAGVFVPGATAPLMDLMQDAEVGEILRYFHDRKRPTALLGHGPVATIASARSGDWPYSGYRMTVGSNAGADALRTAGANVMIAPNPFEPHVVEDRELITGQNPASDYALANAFVAALDNNC